MSDGICCCCGGAAVVKVQEDADDDDDEAERPFRCFHEVPPVVAVARR